MAKTLRCYLPLTLPRLAAQWPTPEPGTAFAPAHAQALRGDALEEAEWTAFTVAAAAAVDDAAAGSCARVVLALDVPTGPTGQPAGDGQQATEVYPQVVALSPVVATASAVVSAHVDEPDTVAELASATGSDAKETILAQADLLWFDASEIPTLVAAQKPSE